MECLHIARAFERADEFDLIHNGFDFLPLSYSGLVDTPVLTTIHGFSSERILPRLRALQRDRPTTSRSATPIATRASTTSRRSTTGSTGEFALAPDAGRLPPLLRADPPGQGHRRGDRRRRRAGLPLLIAGIVQDQALLRRARRAAARRRAGVASSAPSAPSGAAELLGGAYALLHLIDFDEPFGFSVVEAMACGTPVIAFRRGSMPELIADGENGFLVATSRGPSRRSDRRVGPRPRGVRASVEHRFDVGRMVDDYLAPVRSRRLRARRHEGTAKPKKTGKKPAQKTLKERRSEKRAAAKQSRSLDV